MMAIVIIAILMTLLLTIIQGQEQIEQVIIVSRHCDRVPISNIKIPMDPIDWKDQLGLSKGQLTGLGISQCETMGVMLRNRYLNNNSENYISGITSHFDSDLFKFHSTAVDRTIISLNSICQGLFPNGTGLVNDITGRPSLLDDITLVPVHSIEEQNDILLRGFERCPTISKNVINMYASSEFAQLQRNNTPLMQTVANLTGYTIKNFTDFYWLYDVLVVQKSHNLLHIPNLLSNWDAIHQLGDLVNYIHYTRKIQDNLGAGPLIDAIANSFENIVYNRTLKDETPNPKYIHYSAHDSTLESIFATLDIDKSYKELQGVPPYGSQIIFELRKNLQTNLYYVQLIIRLGYDADFVVYKLGSECANAEKCPWNEFRTYVNTKSRVPIRQWCQRCNNDFTFPCISYILESKRAENSVLLIAVPTIAGVSAVFLSIVFILYLRHRKNYYTALP
jgi:hypothetical protein